MRKAIAIAATRQNPFSLAADSLKNSFALAIDFMYGTQERTKITYTFAIALAIFGTCLNIADSHAIMTSCSHDALAATF